MNLRLSDIAAAARADLARHSARCQLVEQLALEPAALLRVQHAKVAVRMLKLAKMAFRPGKFPELLQMEMKLRRAEWRDALGELRLLRRAVRYFSDKVLRDLTAQVPGAPSPSEPAGRH